MSALTVYDPRNYLSENVKSRIIAAGIDMDNYTSNIADKLTMRGLIALRNDMLNEIEEQLHNRSQRAMR